MNTEPNNLVYIGMNSRVAALNEETGETVWKWRAPKGRGYVSLLQLDGQRLIASVMGYTYCLDAETGHQLWFNELPGFGAGVASIASPNASSSLHTLLAAASVAAQAASSSSAANT